MPGIARKMRKGGIMFIEHFLYKALCQVLCKQILFLLLVKGVVIISLSQLSDAQGVCSFTQLVSGQAKTQDLSKVC